MSLYTANKAEEQAKQHRQDVLDGVEAVVNFLRTHPELPLPYAFDGEYGAYIGTKEEMQRLAPYLGTAKKEWGSHFKLVKIFGHNARLYLYMGRETVCKAKVVGKRTIPATPEREVDVIEWECDDTFLNKKGGDDHAES